MLDIDVPQAFTHFTYKRTSRNRMVCNLQGVLNTSVIPPRFELTDAAIHNSRTRRERRIFGKTDRGTKGMHDFLNNHKWNNLCRILGLEKKRKYKTEKWLNTFKFWK